MKKIMMISLILLAIFLTSGPAIAGQRHSRGHFGIFIAPPPLLLPPPPIFYHRGDYPPTRYYGPPEHYYSEPYREWVPGYWEERWGPYGWERVWIPGYWEYRR